MTALVWSTDIKAAPHGRYVIKQRKEGVDTRVFVPEWVILTTKCGKTTRSYYQPEVKRWLMLADGEAPVAWMPWPEPYSLPAAPAAADTPEATLLPVSGDQFRADGGADIVMKHGNIAGAA